MKSEKKKVLVAMSGGVDSSVAAYLLQQEGYETAGVTMHVGDFDKDGKSRQRRFHSKIVKHARKLCKHLGLKHYVLDLSKEMEEYVINNFILEYINGRTPNPCVCCNKYLKFGKLLDYAKRIGFDCLATGHYARIEKRKNRYFLCRPKDAVKDQTYFLYCIKKTDLPRIIFPLAEYTKSQVRNIAEKSRIPFSLKPASQDICFVPDGDYKQFILRRTAPSPAGNIVNKQGVILGRHSGMVNYTIGQRSRLGISGGRPQYVIALDKKNNEVIVGERDDLKASVLHVRNFNRLVDYFPKNVFAKIRYGHKEAACRVSVQQNRTVKVTFSCPQEAVTPGQSIVFYNRQTMLGGGIIKKAR